jgi:hypothetical protein
MFLLFWLACLFPIQTRVSDRSHLVTLNADILFQDAGSRPENNKDTPRESNRRPLNAKGTSPNNPRPCPTEWSGVIRGICSIELSNRTVNKQTFLIIKPLLPESSGRCFYPSKAVFIEYGFASRNTPLAPAPYGAIAG